MNVPAIFTYVGLSLASATTSVKSTNGNTDPNKVNRNKIHGFILAITISQNKNTITRLARKCTFPYFALPNLENSPAEKKIAQNV